MGMQASIGSRSGLDLSLIELLIVDPDQYSVEMLSQIMRGFGLKSFSSVGTGQAAVKTLVEKRFDLVILESSLPDMTGPDLVQHLRRHEIPEICHMPLIIMTGHTVMANIEIARNSGANIVIKKPVSSAALFDRIAWAASTDRRFITSPSYVGPDRRFRSLGPPDGIGRRSTDLSAEVGAASEPNMAQSEIDSFIKPVKIKLD